MVGVGGNFFVVVFLLMVVVVVVSTSSPVTILPNRLRAYLQALNRYRAKKMDVEFDDPQGRASCFILVVSCSVNDQYLFFRRGFFFYASY